MASTLKVRNTRGWLWVHGEILAQHVPFQLYSQHYINTKIKTESLKVRLPEPYSVLVQLDPPLSEAMFPVL